MCDKHRYKLGNVTFYAYLFQCHNCMSVRLVNKFQFRKAVTGGKHEL